MRHTVMAFLAASAFLASGAAAHAQTEPSATPSPVISTPPADEPLVCINQDAGGNSRLGSSRKVCHTQKEWDALPRARR